LPVFPNEVGGACARLLEGVLPPLSRLRFSDHRFPRAYARGYTLSRLRRWNSASQIVNRRSSGRVSLSRDRGISRSRDRGGSM
jgi:hypothetical protein